MLCIFSFPVRFIISHKDFKLSLKKLLAQFFLIFSLTFEIHCLQERESDLTW